MGLFFFLVPTRRCFQRKIAAIMRSRRRSDNQPRTCFVNPARPEAQTVTSAEANKMFENGIRHRGQSRSPPPHIKSEANPRRGSFSRQPKQMVFMRTSWTSFLRREKRGKKRLPKIFSFIKIFWFFSSLPSIKPLFFNKPSCVADVCMYYWHSYSILTWIREALEICFRDCRYSQQYVFQMLKYQRLRFETRNFRRKIWQLPSEMRFRKQQEACQNSSCPTLCLTDIKLVRQHF